MTIDDARENFMSDVYNTLDFLPTNNEANRIIDSFDRVTSGLNQQPCDDNWRFYYNHGYTQAKRDLSCEDCISRQAVKDIICSGVSIDTDADKEYVCELIDKLPSVTPKEKTGKWIDSKDWIERRFDSMNFKKHCSLCDGIGNIQDKYCSMCGAKMVEPQESEGSECR